MGEEIRESGESQESREYNWVPVLRDFATEDTHFAVVFKLKGFSDSKAQEVWITSFSGREELARALHTLEIDGTWYHEQEDVAETGEEREQMLKLFATMRDHVEDIFVGTYPEAERVLHKWDAELGKLGQ